MHSFLILSSLICFAQKKIKGEVILFYAEDKEIVAGKEFIYLKDNFYSKMASDSVYIDENLRFELKNVVGDSVNTFFKPRNYARSLKVEHVLQIFQTYSC